MNIQEALNCAIQKTERNIEKIGSDLREFRGQPDGMYFKEPRNQYLELEHIFNWTQSFFTGMAYWSYKITKEEKYLQWMYGFSEEYNRKVTEGSLETMHDLGFLYTPYAVALYKATGDPNMKRVGIKAADALSKRFIPQGKYIRAWGRMDNQIPPYVSEELSKDHFFQESKGLAIIDCMMNLPLLFWASEVTGHPFYKRIAIAHADTTRKYFIREDYSVCHAYRFDEETGQGLGPENYCGYSKDSYWARGTAWAIYGFAIAYGYTGKEEYLKTAMELSHHFIKECEEDGVPVWDFRLPEDHPALYCGEKQDWIDWDIADAKNKKYNRDTSAAAIAACGFLEILKYEFDEKLQNAVDRMLKTLVDHYMNDNIEVPGLLKCQNGAMIYTSFGDYFFLEALIKKQYKCKNIW